MENHLTLYSSGIGVFGRKFSISGTEAKEIRFPIKKSHRGDVIASLRLFGNVTQKGMVGWPQEEKTQLNIDPNNAQESLLSQLSGRAISFRLRGGNNEPRNGINLGIQTTQEMFGGNIVSKSHIFVLSETGDQNRYPLDQIENLRFTEPEVKSEITKALLNNASRLREGVTHVSLSLVGNDKNEKECLVQYAHPMPSWQPTYRLAETADGKFLLSCFAKADIDSEEDLTDCRLTFIVGEPDTFDTDLAESKTPARRKINLVKRQVSGGHMVEEGTSYQDSELECDSLEAAGGHAKYAAMSLGFAAAPPPAAMALTSDNAATTVQAEAAEVGDYSSWTTPGTFDLKSRQSGLIPLFTGATVEANRVLYYNNKVGAKRPKLAIHMSNPMKQSLGMGVCTVFREEKNRSDMTGESILQAIKPGQKTMLVYGTETGVLVRREQKQQPGVVSSFVLDRGVLQVETLLYATVTYRLKNNKAEEFKVVVDHDQVLPGSRVESKGTISEMLDNGVRLNLALPANGEATLTVTETKLDKQSYSIGNFQTWQHYYAQHSERCKLANNESVKAIVKAQEAVAQNDSQIAALNEENSQLATTAKRLIGYIEKKAGNVQQIGEWQEDMATTERSLRENEKKIAAYTKTRQTLLNALSEAITSARINWIDTSTKFETIK